MPDTQRQPIGLHLAWLLSVAIAGSFVTALIVSTGDLEPFWPLYIIPIVIGSIGYQVSGAIVTTALSSAIVALLVYGAGYESPPTSAILLGMSAYAISGIVIGVQTSRYQRQRRRLQQDATRDETTGAFRADYFSTRLREEIGRGARYDERFTLSLVELIGFDEFQHVYGRVKTELLLQRMTEVLDLTIRSTDLVAHLESGLFAVLMPSTDAEEAEAVAKRVTSAVANAEFEGDALEPIVHRTARVASATYPDDAASEGDLLGLARDRLGASQTPQPTRADASQGSGAASARLGDVPS